MKMVAVFGTMTPKAAAAVFRRSTTGFRSSASRRWTSARCQVMNLMEKTLAKLSELLTGFYRPENDRKISSVKRGRRRPGAASRQQIANRFQPRRVKSSVAQPTTSPEAVKINRKGGEYGD